MSEMIPEPLGAHRRYLLYMAEVDAGQIWVTTHEDDGVQVLTSEVSALYDREFVGGTLGNGNLVDGSRILCGSYASLEDGQLVAYAQRDPNCQSYSLPTSLPED